MRSLATPTTSLALLIASQAAFIAAGLYGFRESVNCPFEKAPLQVFDATDRSTAAGSTPGAGCASRHGVVHLRSD
jgi:hypothetical protein